MKLELLRRGVAYGENKSGRRLVVPATVVTEMGGDPRELQNAMLSVFGFDLSSPYDSTFCGWFTIYEQSMQTEETVRYYRGLNTDRIYRIRGSEVHYADFGDWVQCSARGVIEEAHTEISSADAARSIYAGEETLTHPLLSVREQVLDEAKQCVTRDRNRDYGGPEDNFETIAKLWEAFYGAPFTPTQVGVMSALIKVARMKTSPRKRDHYVDGAGYFACAAQCEEGLK